MTLNNLSNEQQLFCNTALAGKNVRVEACIGSGKTTAIQTLCDLFPKNKLILYLTYNRLLKIDAKNKIHNKNVVVTNYHGFVYPYLVRNGIKCGLSDSIRLFTENRLSIPRFDVLIIDEYQDIELDFAEMLEYIKSTNPNMQIIMVGDMAQKIYDKTTLNVEEWSEKFLGNHTELEFTQCFRLQPELAKKLGRIWGKTIIGVNNNCNVRTMGKSSVVSYLKDKKPSDILCLGAKTGAMPDVLNMLEERYPDKFNKRTVYASIKGGDANVEPNEDAAIFTTYDSSKGMEKPICIVFDWDEAYWTTRMRQPDTNSEILRNIFCVAASRGKQEIIFVASMKYNKPVGMLSEKTLMTITKPESIKTAYVSEMFEFKFVEEITRGYNMLNITQIENAKADIAINDKDCLIDLSPCIREYEKIIFFKDYPIDAKLAWAFQQNGKSIPDVSDLTIDQKLLKLVSIMTHQNRYYNQVKLPFVTPAQHNALINRLSEHIQQNEQTQIQQSMNLKGITINGICDVLRSDSVWTIEFQASLRPENYLQAAMNSILFNRPYAVLWNTKTNEMFKVSVDEKLKKAFLLQVYRIITKQKGGETVLTTKTTKKQSKSLYHYVVGERVTHMHFGEGTIIEIRHTLRNDVLVISFDNDDTRTISEEYIQPA